MFSDRYEQITNDDGAITERLLELGHFEEDCPITTISENKSLSSCFANGTINFKIQLCNR